MIQRSDYVRITDIRQKDLPPDPWERGFSVRGYWNPQMRAKRRTQVRPPFCSFYRFSLQF